MKLKTLNNFNFDNYGSGNPDWSDGESIRKDLRQEAIKWIKTPDIELFNLLQDKIEDGNYNDIYMLKIGLRHFFNIEDKDIL